MKMCDFGISGYLVDSVAKTLDAGCKPYMAVSGPHTAPGPKPQLRFRRDVPGSPSSGHVLCPLGWPEPLFTPGVSCAPKCPFG